MLLSARFLNSVSDVNNYVPATTAEFNAGCGDSLFFQLLDASLDRSDQGYNPSGRRYMPAVGAIMVVTLSNIDTGLSTVSTTSFTGGRVNPSQGSAVVRAATQPFPQDSSIWSIPFLSSDPLQGTVNFRVVLTEPTRVLQFASRPGLQLRFR